jgi:hypothetical protein
MCQATKAFLRGRKIEFTPVTATDEDMDRFRADGHSSFPVVVVQFPDGSTDTWSGFRHTKLSELTK